MSTKTHLKELSTIHAITALLNKEAKFENALAPALKKLIDLVKLRAGWVFLKNDTSKTPKNKFQLVAFTGLPPALSDNNQASLCNGSCECQGMFGRGELDQGVNMVTCSRLTNSTGNKEGLELHASIPMLGKEGPLGIINLTAEGNASFDEDTLEFFTAIGRQLGIAYERSLLQEAQTREARYSAALEERQRLAMDMHDSVAQLLFAADLSAQIGQTLKSRTEKDAALEKTAGLIHDALNSLRQLVELNRPAELSQGLNSALHRLVYRSSGELKAHLDIMETGVEKDVAEAFYRITQEALQNILKHAEATEVWISVKEHNQIITLSLQDNGKGFDSRKATSGLGLTSMKHRSAAIGANFSLKSKPESGTSINVTLEKRSS